MKLIIANAHIKGGMSGSDNIYLHFADSWNAEVWDMLNVNFKPFWLCYIYRIIRGCLQAIFSRQKYEIVYSASDFLMDSIPGFIMKLKGNRWIAGFYLFAPRNTFIYYWSQKVVHWLIMKFAGRVFITSEPDRVRFPGKKVTVVRGGIDYPNELEQAMCDIAVKRYDAIFIGRFHPQKGLMVLIEIWTIVSRLRPNIKLALIGDGPLESNIRREIRERRIGRNITMFGYMEGEALAEVIRQSRVCLHPATYDSGGMAACQAMAYGLPVIGWDLEAYKTYYPKGMIKVDKFMIGYFAMQILKLLDSDRFYRELSGDARAWARENSWHKMMERINADLYTG